MLKITSKDVVKKKEKNDGIITIIVTIIAIIAIGPIVLVLLILDVVHLLFGNQWIDYSKYPWERKGLGKRRGVKVLDVRCPECGCLLKHTWWMTPDESCGKLNGRAFWITFCEECKKITNYEPYIIL